MLPDPLKHQWYAEWKSDEYEDRNRDFIEINITNDWSGKL